MESLYELPKNIEIKLAGHTEIEKLKLRLDKIELKLEITEMEKIKLRLDKIEIIQEKKIKL